MAFGQTYTYDSGVAITATHPVRHNGDAVEAGHTGYESTVTIVNHGAQPVSAALIMMNATVANVPRAAGARRRHGADPGHRPRSGTAGAFRFQVRKGTTGAVQIAVQDTFNDPVFFTGTL